MTRFAAAILLAGLASSSIRTTAAQEESPPPRLIHAGLLEAAELEEVSGLAPSGLRSDIFWAVTDSGNPPNLFAVGLDGTHRGLFNVIGVTNRDWEDIDSFLLEGQPCLLIADTGDNEGRHPQYNLHIVREPPILPGRTPLKGAVAVLRTISFVFEDGPRDCEAVAVDPAGKNVFLLTKRDVPPVLYTLPLAPTGAPAVLTARRVTEVPNIPRPTAQDLSEDRQYGRYRSQVTALDIAPDGSAAAVLTYKCAYLFPRAPDESWADAFRRVPESLRLPRLRQAESLCYSRDGHALYMTSEQRPCPLLRLELVEEQRAGQDSTP
jgi:hypothetical protein